MKQYWVMHRIGKFAVPVGTSNQCKAPGHPDYEYQLKMVFQGDMLLDAEGFIIEHQEIDDLVQALNMAGSCEQLARKISERVDKMLGLKNLPLTAIRVMIRPIFPKGGKPSAWFEFVQTVDPHSLVLLT